MRFERHFLKCFLFRILTVDDYLANIVNNVFFFSLSSLFNNLEKNYDSFNKITNFKLDLLTVVFFVEISMVIPVIIKIFYFRKNSYSKCFKLSE